MAGTVLEELKIEDEPMTKRFTTMEYLMLQLLTAME
jgi:hypothetical protein